jgi:hypothetical protein
MPDKRRKHTTPPSVPTVVRSDSEQPMPKRGTLEWYAAQITLKDEAATKLELQANEFESDMKANGIYCAAPGQEPPDKLWARAVTTAAKLRAEVARLELARDKRSVGKKKVLTTADRIAALKGEQE